MTRDDRGAALIEMALVFTLLVMLLVGIVNGALAYGRQNSIHNAAREASRFAATFPGPVDNTWLDTVRDVARAAATGDLATTVPDQVICVAFINGAIIESLTDTGGAATYPDTECFADGRPATEVRVQIVTQRETTLNAVVFSTDITLSARAAARYERSTS